MEIVSLKRKFKFEVSTGNKIDLEDINPELSPEEVLEMYSTHYATLMNAKVVQKDVEDEYMVYEFVSIAGDKG